MAPASMMPSGISSIMKRVVKIEDRGKDCVLLEVLMILVSILLMLNRFYVRTSVGQKPGLDDYTILASMVFCLAMHGVNIAAIYHGYGQYMDQVPKRDIDIAMKLFYCLQVFYKCTINLTKISILLLYRRIFDTSKFEFRRFCSLVIGLVATYGAASVLVTLFECIPISRVWDRSIAGKCIDFTAFWYSNAVWNISTDLVILLIPIPMIHSLGLPSRTKIALTAVFMLGTFVCITSILRIKTLDTSSKSPDQSHGTFLSTMWSTIEASTAVICACLPMLRVPLSRTLPRLVGSARRGQCCSQKEIVQTTNGENKESVLTKLLKLAEKALWLKRK